MRACCTPTTACLSSVLTRRCVDGPQEENVLFSGASLCRCGEQEAADRGPHLPEKPRWRGSHRWLLCLTSAPTTPTLSPLNPPGSPACHRGVIHLMPVTDKQTTVEKKRKENNRKMRFFVFFFYSTNLFFFSSQSFTLGIDLFLALLASAHKLTRPVLTLGHIPSPCLRHLNGVGRGVV